MLRVERTHDAFYAKIERRNKEYFKQLYRMILQDFGAESFSLLDIGCATGDFLYFSKDELPRATLYGLEVMPELIEKINFGPKCFTGSILDEKTLPRKKFDCITMLSVLQIFDDYKTPLKNAFQLLSENGVLYLFGIYNPENLDVLIKSRASDKSLDDDYPWESGWNCISIESIKMFCESQGFSSTVKPFILNIEIPRNEKDPLRSWTEYKIPQVNEMGGGYFVKNGLQLVHNFYFFRITKSSFK